MGFLEALWSCALQFSFAAGGFSQLVWDELGSMRQLEKRRVFLALIRPPYPFETKKTLSPYFYWSGRSRADVRRAITHHFTDTDGVRHWGVEVVIVRRGQEWEVCLYCRRLIKGATQLLMADFDGFCSRAVATHFPEPTGALQASP